MDKNKAPAIPFYLIPGPMYAFIPDQQHMGC